MSERFARSLIIFIVLIALISLCNWPRAFLPPQPAVAPVTQTLTRTRPSETPTQGPCAFVQASQSLPEISAQWFERLKEAGLPVVDASARAYGENCVYTDGTVERFAAMQTDFHVVLAVETLTNSEMLGNLLTQTLEVLDEFPVEKTPGPNPGYISIVFQAGDLAETVQCPRTQADTLRAQGLSGAQFYEALRSR